MSRLTHPFDGTVEHGPLTALDCFLNHKILLVTHDLGPNKEFCVNTGVTTCGCLNTVDDPSVSFMVSAPFRLVANQKHSAGPKRLVFQLWVASIWFGCSPKQLIRIVEERVTPGNGSERSASNSNVQLESETRNHVCLKWGMLPCCP